MNEDEVIEKTKKELEKLPDVTCFECENLCALGDGTQICSAMSTKEGLVIIEDPKKKIKCPYFERLPDDVIEQLKMEEAEQREDEDELFEDEDEEESLDDIDSIDDLLKD